MSRRGFTLLEIVVCLAIVSLLAVPVFDLFSTSKKITVSGRERMTALNLASSYLASLSEAPFEELREVGRSDDAALPGGLSLEALRMPPAPPGYKRSVSLIDVKPAPEARPLWQATVTVEWRSGVSGSEISYSLQRLF